MVDEPWNISKRTHSDFPSFQESWDNPTGDAVIETLKCTALSRNLNTFPLPALWTALFFCQLHFAVKYSTVHFHYIRLPGVPHWNTCMHFGYWRFVYMTHDAIDKYCNIWKRHVLRKVLISSQEVSLLQICEGSIQLRNVPSLEKQTSIPHVLL